MVTINGLRRSGADDTVVNVATVEFMFETVVVQESVTLC